MINDTQALVIKHKRCYNHLFTLRDISVGVAFNTTVKSHKRSVKSLSQCKGTNISVVIIVYLLTCAYNYET